MYEERLREVLEKIFGEYVPNQPDMDNLVSYLYKVCVCVFKDADMKKEYKSIKGITQLDVDGFKKAIKDISLFTSQRVLIETLNKSYKELKNVIPQVKVDDAVSEQIKRPVTSSNNAVAEAEFSIDVKSVPKVRKSKKENVQPTVEKISSEFEPDVQLDLDKINKGTPAVGTSSNDGGDLTLNAGFIGSSGFSSVPNVDISLDY